MKKQILPKIKKTLQDKEINTKQLKITSLIILVIALILIVGGTLATFNFDASLLGGDIKVNKCKLIINIKDDNPITLLEAYPISDDKINEYQPYTFTVTNKSTCENAHYRITLGDICATCTKNSDTCDVNGQSLNCNDANQISPHKINYQLINKKTNKTTNYFNPNTLEVVGSLAKGESIDFELKLWLDYTTTKEELYVYENGVPKENSDGSFVTKNVGYKVNVESGNYEFSKEYQSEIPVIPQDNSGANVPVLTDNMIPIFYDEVNGVWRKADTRIQDEENPWYDYDQKKWANAVILDGGATDFSPLEEIPVDMVAAWFVWIPRYKYTYFSSRDPVEIPITFEKGRQSTGTIKCRETIPTTGGIKETCTDTTNGSLILGTSTYTHPAFTFGDEELTGIWVGKFETSEYDKSIPGAVPTSDATMNEAFEFTRSLDSFPSSYYFPQTSENFNVLTGEIIRDSNNLDPHIMKNMEWGAVAYLSHSKYGTCTDGFCEEVGKNNYLSANNEHMTGCGAEAGSPVSDVCNEYYTSEGMLASTTRNIYGIYDMSGGLEEAVMANVQENGDFYYGDNTWSETEKPLNKYYEKYDFNSRYENETEMFKLGDATIELQYTFIENSSGGGYSTTWYDGEFAPGNPGWVIRGSGLFTNDLPFKGIFGICSYEMSGSGYRIALAVYSHRENIE